MQKEQESPYDPADFGKAAEEGQTEEPSAALPNERQEETGEFEFAFLTDDPDIAVADEIFFDGQIRPVYPLFDKALFRLYTEEGPEEAEPLPTARAIRVDRDERKGPRVPLRKLMIDGDALSSDDSHELDGLPAESYCLWTPGSVPTPSSPEMRRKSKSTGSSSLRWKLRDLVVGRSNSDGKQKFILLAPAYAQPKASEMEKKRAVEGEHKERKKEKASAMKVAEVHRAGGTTTERRRTYLPYRTGLVGFYAGVGGGSSGGLQPFS